MARAANGASSPWPGTSSGCSSSSPPDKAEVRQLGRQAPKETPLSCPFNRLLHPIQRPTPPQPAKIICGDQTQYPVRQAARTLEKVKTEMSLQVLAYTMKRMINIFGVNPLMQAIAA